MVAALAEPLASPVCFCMHWNFSWKANLLPRGLSCGELAVMPSELPGRLSPSSSSSGTCWRSRAWLIAASSSSISAGADVSMLGISVLTVAVSSAVCTGTASPWSGDWVSRCRVLTSLVGGFNLRDVSEPADETGACSVGSCLGAANAAPETLN